jgi:hypothetical protein
LPSFLWDNFFKKMEFALYSINSLAKAVAFMCIALNFVFLVSVLWWRQILLINLWWGQCMVIGELLPLCPPPPS